MIDPLGPDPNDPNTNPRQVAEIPSDFETPKSLSPLRPKVRYANYDSPEAQIRTEAPTRSDASRLASPSRPSKPLSEAASGSTLPAEPVAAVQPSPSSGLQPVSRPAPTALARSAPQPHKPTKLERAVGVARTVLPLIGKMLPLLEGNVVSAASNLLAHRPMHEVNLKPLEESIARLQADQRALAFHTSEQKSALRRLEDDFVALQETVRKNADDQAELIEQVAKFAKRTSSFMRLVIILLIACILFTALLCVRIAYIIRY